jgi:phosphoglycolate phosphatase
MNHRDASVPEPSTPAGDRAADVSLGSTREGPGVAAETATQDGPGAGDAVRRPRYRAKPKFAFPLHLKAVLLDLDGTLLDTAGDIVQAANRMRVALGFAPLDAALLKSFVGKGVASLVSKTLKDAVGDVGPTALKVAVASFERHYEQCFGATSHPFPGVIEGLEALRQKGLRLACVTNKPAKFTEPLLARTGLSAYFELVVSGDTLAEKKPRPLPLEHAAAFFDARPNEVLLIGDSVNDAVAARAAGFPVFIVPYGYNEGQELRGLDCDAFIDNLPAALKLVRLAA